MGFGDFLKKAADKGAALAQDAKKAATELAANLTKKYGIVNSGRHEGCEIALGNPPGSGIVSNSLTQIIFLEGTEEKGRYNITDLAMVRQTGFEKGGERRNIIKIEYPEGDESELLVKFEVGSPFFSQVVWHKKFKAILDKEKEAAEKEKKEREAAEEAERKEKERAERISKALEPSCEKGDCLWNNGKFYYICDECVECNRKNSTKNKQDKVKYPQLWKYMKRYEASEKIRKEKTETFELAKEHFGEEYGVVYESGERDDYYHSLSIEQKAAWEVINDNWNDILNSIDMFASELFDEFMPAYTNNITLEVKVNLSGITTPFFDLLWDLKDMDIDISDDIWDILFAGELEISDDLSYPLELDQDIYRNPSLYNRSIYDFRYTLEMLLLTASEKDETYKKLFDNDGNILPAGIGGPEKGFYDPCIWNVIHNNL